MFVALIKQIGSNFRKNDSTDNNLKFDIHRNIFFN